MNVRALAVAAAGVTVMLAGAREAHALWVRHSVTPKNHSVSGRAFRVEVTDRDQWKQFVVTMDAQPCARKLSPFTSGELCLVQGNERVASVPVHRVWKDGLLVFRFRVNPQAIVASTFEVSEGNYAAVRDAAGNTQVGKDGQPQEEAVLGGQFFELKLRDFSPAAAPPAR